MYINRALLEASGGRKHFMTAEERKVKKKLCQLLIDKKHVKYARRFWEFDFNLVDASKFPEFTAAVSFDEATVYLSTGFLGSGTAIFNQLDVLLRHELAHNLMMHQIRMMYIFKQHHTEDPDEAYKSLSASASLHKLMNVIEDLEISNKRYSAEDKKIVHYMTLNGRLIGGLVTDELRPNWVNMSLEDMYREMTQEILSINSEIRNDPNWTPEIPNSNGLIDPIKGYTAQALLLYSNAGAPSKIFCPLEDYIQTKEFSKFIPQIQKIMSAISAALKDYHSTTQEQDAILDLVNQIAGTEPQEKFILQNPFTGEFICNLYTPEEKFAATEALKNLGGLINTTKYKAKIKINKASHSKEYTDAWNEVVTKLSGSQYDNQTLQDLLDKVMNS